MRLLYLSVSRIIVFVAVFIALFLYSYLGERVHWYFASRLFCSVSSQTITVSLTPQMSSCFALIKELNVREDKLEEDVARALWFVQNGEDVEYRESVFLQLRLQQQHLAALQKNLALAMSAFERDLFRRVLSVVRFQLQDERINLFATVDALDEDIAAARQAWDHVSYTRAVRTKDEFFMRIVLLDAIYFARSFDTLMPALHHYLSMSSSAVSLSHRNLLLSPQ
jgi:hypothetical protein